MRFWPDTRSSMLDVRVRINQYRPSQGYLEHVIFKQALRNALIPVVTTIGLRSAFCSAAPSYGDHLRWRGGK